MWKEGLTILLSISARLGRSIQFVVLCRVQCIAFHSDGLYCCRRGSIQTAPQENFIKDFERQFLMLCNTFGDNDFVLPPIVNGDIAVAVDPTTVSVPLTARPVQSNRVGSPGARLTSPKSTPVKPKGGDTDSNGDALSVSTGGGMIQNLNVSSLDPSAFPEGLMSPGRANKSRGLAQIITGGLKPTPPKSRPFASTVPKTIHDTVKSQHFTLLSSEMLEYRYVAKCIVVTNKTVKECVNVLSACSGDVSAADQTPVKLLPHILSLVGKVNEYELCVHCGAVSSDYQSSALYLHQFTEDTALRDALRILRQKVNTCEYESNWLSSYALPSSDGACVGELWLKYEDRCSCLCVLLLNWLDSRQDALLTSVFMAELAALAADYPISASSANAEGVATGQVTLTCYLDGIRRLLSRVKAATLGHIIAILGSLHVTNPAVVDSGVNFRELLALRFAVSMLPYDLRTAARFVFLRVMQDLLGSHAVADTNSSSSSTSVSSLLSAYGQESNVFESTVKSGKDKMLEQSKEKGYSFKSDRAVISPSILSSSSSDVASSVSSVTSSENADNTMVRSVIEEMIGRYDIVSSLIAPGADVSGMDMGVGMAGNAGGIRWKPGVPAAATLPVTVPVV